MKKYYILISVVHLVLNSSVFAADWPQWRGPNRDGISPETGLLNNWPEQGPTLIRKIEGIGKGFSHPIIIDDTIYVAGNKEGDLCLSCFDSTGRLIWQATNGKAFKKSFPGSRSTPTFDQGTLYSFSGLGRLAAYQAKTGKEIWHVNTQDKFNGRNPFHGLAESPLVCDDYVICSPLGLDASIVALDKRTGKTAWQVGGLNHEKTYPKGHDLPYTSSIAFNFEGVQQIATLSNTAMFGLSLRDGEILWRFDRASNPEHNINNCSTPGYFQGHVFAFQGSAGAVHGGGVARLSKNQQGKLQANLIWETQDMLPEHGGYVLVDGYLYGNHDKKGWCCIDFNTGKTMWIAKGIRNGSIIYADGMLYCYSEKGTIALVLPDPNQYKMVSSFKVPNPRNQNWAHPAISNGKLYIRNIDELYIYKISKAPN